MNRPIFPRIPESRRRAQERASVRPRPSFEQPAATATPPVVPTSAREPVDPLQRSQGSPGAPTDPGAS
jgi:hypothetical protein